MTESIKCPKGHAIYQTQDYEFVNDETCNYIQVYTCETCDRPYFEMDCINSEVTTKDEASEPDDGWIDFDKQQPRYGQLICVKTNDKKVGSVQFEKITEGLIISEFVSWKPADKLTIEKPKVDNEKDKIPANTPSSSEHLMESLKTSDKNTSDCESESCQLDHMHQSGKMVTCIHEWSDLYYQYPQGYGATWMCSGHWICVHCDKVIVEDDALFNQHIANPNREDHRFYKEYIKEDCTNCTCIDKILKAIKQANELAFKRAKSCESGKYYYSARESVQLTADLYTTIKEIWTNDKV